MNHSNSVAAGRRVASAAASVILVAALALTGCSGDDPGPPPPDDADPVDPAPADDGASGDSPFDSPEAEALARCTEGRWSLDTEAYAIGAAAYMVSLGPVPLESLTLDGTLLLDITEETIGQSVDLTWNAVLMGIGVTVVDQSSGVGDLRWWDDGFDIHDWLWGVEPGEPSADAPAVPSPSIADGGFVLASCTDTSLVLNGDGAPLTAIFFRDGS